MNWQQLKAIVWLRCRLTRNQFRRGGQLNAVLTIIAISVLLLGALGATVAGVAGGFFAGWKAPAPLLLIIWDAVVFAFLIFWFAGLMVEIQRSETIDLPKLLHLPVTLGQVFVFNYLASHFTPGIVLVLPGMLGLCAGLTAGGGPAMALLVPLVLSFVFMVTAWTYCLRGWLAALMVNKRRRRAIIVWVTLIFVVVCQLPNLVFNSPLFRQQIQSMDRASHRHGKGGGASSREQGGLAIPDSILQAHLVLPPGWIGYSAMALKQRNAWPALGATAAGCLVGVLGLMRAYRMTIRFYQGADGRVERKPAQARAPGRRGVLLVERRLPWLPDDTAALVLATFRSLTRAPELKMAFVMPLVMGAMLVFVRFSHMRRGASGVPELMASLVATGLAVGATFSIAPMMSNIFGLDRSGFRALVLLGTRRHHILLAKNLACAPFAALIALALLLGVTLMVKLPWTVFPVCLLQAAAAFLLFSLMGNVLSILAPFRLSIGTLQAKKPKAVMFVGAFVTLLCLPLILVLMEIPPVLQLVFTFLHWAPWPPVNLIATIGLLAAAVGLYRLLLPWEGRLLARREQKILKEVTEEAE